MSTALNYNILKINKFFGKSNFYNCGKINELSLHLNFALIKFKFEDFRVKSYIF